MTVYWSAHANLPPPQTSHGACIWPLFSYNYYRYRTVIDWASLCMTGGTGSEGVNPLVHAIWNKSLCMYDKLPITACMHHFYWLM